MEDSPDTNETTHLPFSIKSEEQVYQDRNQNIMGMRLCGAWKEDSKDRELQDQFWNVMKGWKNFSRNLGQTNVRISTLFLRENYEWFLA